MESSAYAEHADTHFSVSTVHIHHNRVTQLLYPAFAFLCRLPLLQPRSEHTLPLLLPLYYAHLFHWTSGSQKKKSDISRDQKLKWCYAIQIARYVYQYIRNHLLIRICGRAPRGMGKIVWSIIREDNKVVEKVRKEVKEERDTWREKKRSNVSESAETTR